MCSSVEPLLSLSIFWTRPADVPFRSAPSTITSNDCLGFCWTAARSVSSTYALRPEWSAPESLFGPGDATARVAAIVKAATVVRTTAPARRPPRPHNAFERASPREPRPQSAFERSPQEFARFCRIYPSSLLRARDAHEGRRHTWKRAEPTIDPGALPPPEGSGPGKFPRTSEYARPVLLAAEIAAARAVAALSRRLGRG